MPKMPTLVPKKHCFCVFILHIYNRNSEEIMFYSSIIKVHYLLDTTFCWMNNDINDYVPSFVVIYSISTFLVYTHGWKKWTEVGWSNSQPLLALSKLLRCYTSWYICIHLFHSLKLFWNSRYWPWKILLQQ